MERNEESKAPAAQTQASGGCSCGCGGGKQSNKAVIILWVVLLLGFAGLAMWSRMNADSSLTEPERLLKQAYELFEKQKFEEGAACLRQSAEMGNAWAQMYYGGSLKKGVGVEQNLPAAAEWFRKSADQGCTVAFYELAVCSENGEGVDRNLDEALAWYRKAKDAGIEEAQSAIIRVEKLQAQNEAGSD